MSVVLRCANCGTTQGQVGECEACSEGEVRYFCTNHDQGIWLGGPVCSRCGATFGDPPRRPAPAPLPPPVPTRPAGAPDFRPPARRRTRERPPEPDFVPVRPPRRPDREEPVDPEVVPRTPSLGELLEAISEARAHPRAPYEVEDTPWAGPPRPGVGFPLAGCLIRILSLGFLLFLALVVFVFLLFGGLIGT